MRAETVMAINPSDPWCALRICRGEDGVEGGIGGRGLFVSAVRVEERCRGPWAKSCVLDDVRPEVAVLVFERIVFVPLDLDRQ